MKLLRVGEAGRERPAAVLSDGTVVDIGSLVDDINTHTVQSEQLRQLRESLEGAYRELPLIDLAAVRVGPPISGIGKIVCVGLNYAEHVRESGQSTPAEPILFLKTPYTVVGPNDDVVIPPGSDKTDYEVELAVVMGRTARYLSEFVDPLDYVAGYSISNDVSERAYQLERGGQWDKGKNCETFNPLGPWLVTTDEVADPQSLDLLLSVNGETRQSSSTSNMIFGVASIIRYVSQFMTLLPGDIINTGTPSGVGAGFTPTRFLSHGDVVELSISGLGAQKTTCRNYLMEEAS